MMFWVVTVGVLGFMGGLTLGFMLAADRYYKQSRNVVSLEESIRPTRSEPTAAPMGFVQAPQCDFEAPVLSSIPLHEFKECVNSPYCEVCGGGALHIVHAQTPKQHRQVWNQKYD